MPVSAMRAKTKNDQRDQTNGNERYSTTNKPLQPMRISASVDGRYVRKVDGVCIG